MKAEPVQCCQTILCGMGSGYETKPVYTQGARWENSQ